MAYWDGGSGTSDGRRTAPGSDSSDDQSESQEMIIDDEMNVNEQTDDIVYGIIEESIPNAQPILGRSAGSRIERRVIQRLGTMGDELERNNRNEFREMFHQLGLHTRIFISYTDFYAFAKNMFSNGINMGRIMILLAFVCYAIKLKQGFKNGDQIMKNIVYNVLRFLKEEISVWIAKQGGWKAALNKEVEKARTKLPFLIGFGACATVFIYYMYS